MLDGLKLFKQRASESIARIFTTPTSVMNHHHPTNDHQQQQQQMMTNHEVLQTPSMMMMTMASGSNEDDLIQEDIISIMGVDSITKALQDNNNHHDTYAVPDGKIFFVRKASGSSSLGSLSLAGSSEKILASRNNSNVILSSRNNSGASYLSFIWTTRDNSNATIV
jgi:hypothetical protein